MSSSRLSQKTFRDKVVAEYFAKDGGGANINGHIFSTSFRKLDENGKPLFVGRERVVGTDYDSKAVYRRKLNDPGFKGRGIKFDGIAQRCTFSYQPDHFYADTQSNFTCITFYKNDSGVNDHFGASSGSTGGSWLIGVQADGKIYLRVGTDPISSGGANTWWSTAAGVVDPTVWNLIAVTYDYSQANVEDRVQVTVNTMKYTGGDLSVQHKNGGYVPFTSGSSLFPLGLGFHNATQKAQQLAELSMYGRILTDDEIQDYSIAYPDAEFYASMEGTDPNEGFITDLVSGEKAEITGGFDSSMWVGFDHVQLRKLWINKKGYNSDERLNLVGNTGALTLKHSTALNITGAITVFGWMKTGVGSNNNTRPLMGKFTTTGPFSVSTPSWYMAYYLQGLVFQVSADGTYSGNSIERSGEGTVPQDEWCFVLGQFNPAAVLADRVIIELNNVDYGSTAFNGINADITTIHAQELDVTLGWHQGRNDEWDVELKGWGIVPRILSHAEKLALYNGGNHYTPTAPADAVAFLACDFENQEKDLRGGEVVLHNTPEFVRRVVPEEFNGSNDIDGYEIENKGALAPVAQLVGSSCLKLNGVNQSFKSSAITLDDKLIRLSCYFKLESYSTWNMHLISWRDSSGEDFLTVGIKSSNGNLRVTRRFFATSASQINTETDISTSLNVWHRLLFERISDTEFHITLDEQKVVFDSETSADLNTTCFLTIGQFGNGTGWTNASICDFSLNDGVGNKRYYPLSEANEVEVHDLSVNADHRAVDNAVLPEIWELQPLFHHSFYKGVQHCLYLNGVDQFCKLGQVVHGLSDFSAFIWMKSTRTDSAIFSKYDVGTNDRGWSIQLTNSSLEVYLSSNGLFISGSTKRYEGSTNLSDNAWHLVGFTFSGGVLKLYVDGSEEVVTKVWDPVVSNVYDSGADVAIGTLLNSGTYLGTPYSGLLADSAIWDEALQPAAIGSLYSLQIPRANLLGFWPLNEGSGTGLADNTKRHSSGAIINPGSNWMNLPLKLTDSFKDGHAKTGRWNGASVLQFPDIPEMPSVLRGNNFNLDELKSEATTNGLLEVDENNRILILSEPLTTLEKLRL